MRAFSTAFLVLAIALGAYGLFDLSHFAWYTGEYFDDRLVLFDNGVYATGRADRWKPQLCCPRDCERIETLRRFDRTHGGSDAD